MPIMSQPAKDEILHCKMHHTNASQAKQVNPPVTNSQQQWHIRT